MLDIITTIDSSKGQGLPPGENFKEKCLLQGMKKEHQGKKKIYPCANSHKSKDWRPPLSYFYTPRVSGSALGFLHSTEFHTSETKSLWKGKRQPRELGLEMIDRRSGFVGCRKSTSCSPRRLSRAQGTISNTHDCSSKAFEWNIIMCVLLTSDGSPVNKH